MLEIGQTTNIGRYLTAIFQFEPWEDDTLSIGTIELSDDLSKGEYLEELVIPSKFVSRDKKENGKIYQIRNICYDVLNLAWERDDINRIIGSQKHPIGRLVISEGITSIEPSAFEGAYADTVVWPKSCPIVEASVFRNASVKHFEGMEEVTAIDEDAFSGNQVIEEFNWPKGCRVIPYNCFSKDKNLSKINISAQIDEIEEYAFLDTAISEIDLSDSFVCDIAESEKKRGIRYNLSYYHP
jgi:hypothetical protein